MWTDAVFLGIVNLLVLSKGRTGGETLVALRTSEGFVLGMLSPEMGFIHLPDTKTLATLQTDEGFFSSVESFMILQTRERGDPLAAVLAGEISSASMNLMKMLLEASESTEDLAAEVTLVDGLFVANHMGFELTVLVPDSPTDFTHIFPSILYPLWMIPFYVALQCFLRAMKVSTESAIEFCVVFGTSCVVFML